MWSIGPFLSLDIGFSPIGKDQFLISLFSNTQQQLCQLKSFQNTRNVLPMVIIDLKAKRYKFVAISELLALTKC
jgi:hypothetical protein